jgi:hypothetical protein
MGASVIWRNDWEISMRRPESYGILIAIAVALANSLCAQSVARPRDLQIQGHGSLRLAVPEDWQIGMKTLKEPASVMLHLVPKTGNSFDIQLTAVWLDAEQLAKVNSESIKENMQRAAAKLLPRSVEKVANVRSFRGRETVGHYYALTDRDPAPGEFKYLTQGTFLAGEALSMFTILYSTPTAPEVDQTIRIFTEATYAR